ncbi:hypothetical protein DACRYDRAFT_82035 [Dacryopinax primogenitus]|uniref:T6SS Phospholipase effector Tle1-like catalytic domain-containing protein n=1 Tax=Dacryopinax primogenitus (strain DJM 731) TaxID=1858805 RepID=M5FTZ2_DACPD|nr:uncharacterized protein DACRYDRAFT_82035 [Dacryopinax primogenitus]EJT99623.1 hypothetical protein DACRYDRAFT_82035 [Dacryopinax primogenitus]
MPAVPPQRQTTYGTMDGVPYHEPPAHPRRLIVCFDGTANLFEGTNTNVVHLVSYLKKDDLQEQQVYYQTGVGTYISPGIFMPLIVDLLKIMDEGIAWDLPNHIMGGYRFLMNNWTRGSNISIFGFSRGAYTARALAGMLEKVGLLSRGNEEQIPFAYRMYINAGATGWAQSRGFKRAFSHEVHVDFLGVWDTVASVGIFTVKDLPLSSSARHIRVFRHAISLDERRCKFKENLWQAPFTPPGSSTLHEADKKTVLVTHPHKFVNEPTSSLRDEEAEAGSVDLALGHHAPTDVLEVWFAGGHGDVGGGNVKNGQFSSTNRIPLTWMIREIVLANTGIVFDEEALAADGIILPQPNPQTTIVSGDSVDKSQTTRVLVIENHISNLNKRYAEDVVALVFDQLKLKWAWWILEIMPFTYRIARKRGGPGHWKLSPWPNNGGPRSTPDGRMKVHVSVRERAEKTGYKSNLRWNQEPEWVE